MHTKQAMQDGESFQRIFLLIAWRETDLFTEEVTLIHENGLTPETYNKAISIFNEKYFAQIIIAITTINAWNRIAISTNKPIGN
ncbi:hypothetical protein GCM10011506_00580 [Marivirga lumbricoides]|uniref:Carboxymuconolactone decarboxylase-like domain-containing protein n=1 Tax=Marivirga lumbricoides TaxID=1046115 RepID=A0ABQ1L5W5_9BACT|nr:hypothetical protein GCM10011506_00580 [Marivirga lumbricoides]